MTSLAVGGRRSRSEYAHSHRASSYRKLPPVNQAEAAIEYISKHNVLPAEQVSQFKASLSQVKTDPEAQAWASALWSMTGVGNGKAAWDAYMSRVKSKELTKAK